MLCLARDETSKIGDGDEEEDKGVVIRVNFFFAEAGYAETAQAAFMRTPPLRPHRGCTSQLALRSVFTPTT